MARIWLLTATVAGLVLAGCGGQDQPSSPPATTTPTPPTTVSPPAPDDSALGLDLVAEGFDSPTHLAASSDGLYVVEQPGRVVALASGDVFLDITDQVLAGGEQGLLSLAFHPDYATNGLFYVNYTDRDGDTRVVEYRAGSEPKRLRELLHVGQPYSNHNGGQLAFGPDERLYVGMGDGGAGGDPEGRAQDPDERLGKLLARDVDGGGEWQMVGLGLRNPWRFSFDRRTGDLWLGDVGQDQFEEIDFRPRAKLAELANYGWDVYEGSVPFEDNELGPGELVEPVAEYSHDGGHCSVTGGFLYRGKIKEAQGRYFYGDYCSGTVWSLGPDLKPRQEPFAVPSLSSFGEGPDGELYLLSQGGAVYRLS